MCQMQRSTKEQTQLTLHVVLQIELQDQPI